MFFFTEVFQKKIFIWRKESIKNLLIRFSNSKPGRTNAGRISIRHRSARKNVPFTRLINNKPFLLQNEFCQVIRLERIPNRSSFLSLVRFLKSGFLGYLTLPDCAYPGSIISLNPLKYNTLFFKKIKIMCTALPLFRIPKGSFVCNLELKAFSGSQICRAAGSKAKLQSISVSSGLASILLPSGKIAHLPLNSHAFIGIMSNVQHSLRFKNKAGQNSILGLKSRVRGVAMNPVDHPHGGGEGKTSGGRPSVSPWGFLTKGYKTISNKNKKRVLLLKNKYLRSFTKNF